MKIDEGKVLLLLTGVLSGIVLISFLLNTSFNPTSFLSYRDYTAKKAEQNNLQNELNNLNRSLGAIDQKLKLYHTDEDKNKVISRELEQELKRLQMDYGTTEVSGSGIIVTLRDRNYYLNDFDRELQENLVHNTDILNIVLDLINAGAEAIAINGRRYVTSMAVTCVGPIMGLRLGPDEEIIAPPFVIEAIGDQEILNNYLNDPDSHYQMLIYRELPVTIQKSTDLKIKASPMYGRPEIMEIKVK